MGQRANYILIKNSTEFIYYNHWRANCITSDLYLGDKRFIDFVRSCKLVDVLLDEVWIEGCVIINIDKKMLHFWSLEFGVTSTTDFYLSNLQDKWKDWSINLLYNKMYDVEQILNIDYLSQQDLLPLPLNTVEEINNDEVSEFGNTIIVIKTVKQTTITKLGSVSVDGILHYGESVVDILLNKSQYELPKEEEDSVFGLLIIDAVGKKIIIDKSEFGLWEQCQSKWQGFNFAMGDFGYIGALRLAGIDVEGLEMSPEKIKVEFDNLVRPVDSFDSIGFAKELLKERKDINFSPEFFDNASPKQTMFKKFNGKIYKLLRAFAKFISLH